MNTKTFAQESRRNLLEGVSKKLHYWGFNEDGSSSEQPQSITGGYSFRGQVHDDPEVPKLWDSLKAAVNKHGVDVVIEKAAYTWFNRITALRILSKNGYERAKLEYVEGMTLTPQILQSARQGKYAFLSKTEQDRLQKIITDYSKDQEAFAILLIGFCHSHPTLQRVFGGIDDYTELLLPDNILQESGFLHLLNTTDAISDEDYQEVELIGWLYQFYISEKKDEVFTSFKKNKKAEAKDIPAATQIFTPNWIVKYMVENTAGKIWLDKQPNSPLKSQMKCLVENDSDSTSEAIISSVEELTLIDPACGSGHILVEGFDLIYQMYMEEYYTPEETVQSIFKNNLFGLDIDDRA
ncbi:MAG: BREX-1 system adenine-specific DNA-methyltransferase PglX, partial [Balneolaceae bacterium]|nr:BREX-1 system adenine-specific DNA-methyltransferase PglX [Balneolaceae bacterium]